MDCPLPSSPISDVLLRLQQDSSVLVAVFDAQDRLCHANGAYAREFGLAELPQAVLWSELVQACHAQGRGEFIEADDLAAWLAVAGARRRRQRQRAYAMELCDGRSLWMTETVDEGGWLMMVGVDITALADGQALLRSQRATPAEEPDPVTGLRRRRASLRRLQQTLCAPDAWPLSLVLLAVDAPWAGDADCARDLAQQLAASLRQEDGTGLLDPNAYLLILPNAGPGQARAIVERLLARLRQARPHSLEGAPAYRCSAGIAQARWGEAVTTTLQGLQTLLARAQAGGGDAIALELDEEPGRPD